MSSVPEKFETLLARQLRRPSTNEMGPLTVLAIAAAAVAAVGVIDYATGPRLEMIVLYMVPVAWAASAAGRAVGVTVALLSAAAGILCDLVLSPHYGYPATAATNVAFMLVALVVVVELIHRLRLSALAATAAEQNCRDFLGYAAHQLRTPVARINGAVDALMLNEQSNADQELLITRLGSEAARAGRLVNALLRIARLDQHEPLTMQPIDPSRIICNEIDRAARTRPDISWDTQFGSDTLLLEGDTYALSEATANLLDNACRHARTRVTVRGSEAGSMFELEVRDDGPGIPADQVDAVFQRFVTLEPNTGTGLGLPIARGIAEAHGGTLTYEANSFLMRIPLRRSPHLAEHDNRDRRSFDQQVPHPLSLVETLAPSDPRSCTPNGGPGA